MAKSTSCGSTNFGAEGFGATSYMSRKDLVPVVPYSWFPFPGTRGENTWGSRATKRSWVHVEEGEALELVMQAVYFCVRFERGREQGPQPFAAETLAFWAWQP